MSSKDTTACRLAFCQHEKAWWHGKLRVPTPDRHRGWSRDAPAALLPGEQGTAPQELCVLASKGHNEGQMALS